MPARDGTGPRAEGSRTGRSAGNCPENSVNQITEFAPRRGFGRGLRWGHGGRYRRFRFRGVGMRRRGWLGNRLVARMNNDGQEAR